VTDENTAGGLFIHEPNEPHEPVSVVPRRLKKVKNSGLNFLIQFAFSVLYANLK